MNIKSILKIVLVLISHNYTKELSFPYYIPFNLFYLYLLKDNFIDIYNDFTNKERKLHLERLKNQIEQENEEDDPSSYIEYCGLKIKK